MIKIKLKTLVKKRVVIKNLHGSNYIEVDMVGEFMGVKPGDIIKIADSCELVIGFTDKDGKLEGSRQLVWTLAANNPNGIQEYSESSFGTFRQYLLKKANKSMTPEAIETAIREFEEFVNFHTKET